MNSVRSLMGDVSFHGMATPPRCAMLREAVTHIAGLRCYPCRRTVPRRVLTLRSQFPPAQTVEMQVEDGLPGTVTGIAGGIGRQSDWLGGASRQRGTR